jgi:formimidoylglutamate deiminase
MRFWAERALLPEGVRDDVAVEVDRDGVILRVEAGALDDGGVRVRGLLVPGMGNVHSHVFQRLIGGWTQRLVDGENSFWSWREQMYAAANSLDPDAFEAVAEAGFGEMLDAGFTSVAEFHYVHAGPGGVPYADPAELSERVIAAALRVGLSILLLPVLYLHSDFGGAALLEEQRRFSLGLEGYLELWRSLYSRYRDVAGVRIGFAPHSLRAVTIEELRYALGAVRSIDASVPVHIHIAEQRREVDACLAALGATPLAFLIDAVGIDERWCLVHATHVSDVEMDAVVEAGAVVGLCPTTEADLGDGVFPAARFVAKGGRFAIGSDSNVRVSVSEELRMLEYSQRLTLERRNVLATPAMPSTGEALYRGALAGGSAALGLGGGAIVEGARGPLVVLVGDGEAADVFDEFVFSGRARLYPLAVG